MNSCNLTDTNASTCYRCNVPPQLPPAVPIVVEHLQATIAIVTIFASLLLNGLIVYLVIRYKHLHCKAFYLTLQFNVLHLVYTCLVLVFIFATAIKREWFMGQAMCVVLGMLHDAYASARLLLTLILAFDRFLTVYLPFFYPRHGGKVAVLMSLVVWIFSLGRVLVLQSGGLDCYAYTPVFKMCTAVNCSQACQIFVLTHAVLLWFLGVLVPLLLYIFLFSKARIMRTKLRRMNHTGSTANEAQYRPHTSKQDRRATVTFLILVFAVVLCATPPITLYIVQFAFTGPPPAVLISLQILVGRTLFNGFTIADPIVIMRNADIREALRSLRKKILPKCCYNSKFTLTWELTSAFTSESANTPSTSQCNS